MGRPKSNHSHILIKLFSDNEERIVVDGKFEAPKSAIWSRLRNQLRSSVQMKEKAIYSAALRWWKDKEKPLTKRDSKFGKEFEMSVDNSNLNTDEEDGETDDAESKSTKVKIQLPHKVWKTIEPVEMNYARRDTKKGVRTYYVLQPGVWSNVVVDLIAQKRNVPCAWSFKTNKCYTDNIKFQAKCVTCSANLFGAITKIPEENEPAIVNVEIEGINLRRHESTANRNVNVVGQFRKNNFMSGKPAIVQRRQMMAESASIFKKPKGRIVTANSIRCRKYKSKLKEKLSTCPYTALMYLKWSSKYMNTIHHVSMDPFLTWYTSPDQLKLYKVYKKKNHFTKMSGDATGGVTHKLDRPGGQKSKAILLYSLVISDGFQVPVASALSEKGRANYLTFWLSEWVRAANDIPNQFTCDMSMAFLNAAVRAFALLPSVASYINLVFNVINGKASSTSMPPCFVRIDIAHLMKDVAKCDALKNTPKKVRDFYIRCVALLLQTENINDARELIFSVFIVANSLTEGNSELNERPVPCETHKSKIIRKITGVTTVVNKTILLIENEDEEILLDEEIEDADDDSDNLSDGIDKTSLHLWLNDIATRAKQTIKYQDNGNRDNLMQNSKFSAFFFELCKLLPLWSGLCCKYFDGSELIGSSSNVESYFKDAKLSHGDIIPCSVDQFVQEDIDMINGMIIDASQNYIEFVTDNAGTTSFDTTNDRSVNDVGNTPNDESANGCNDISIPTNDNITNDQSANGFNDITISTNDDTAQDTTSYSVDEHSFESFYQLYHKNSKPPLLGRNLVDANDIDITTNLDTVKDANNVAIDIEGDTSSSDEITSTRCPACTDNNLPTGAHTCIECGKNVHLLPGCSVSCSDREGYGEKRICSSCFNKISVHNVIAEMDHMEEWDRKSRKDIKKSKYLAPAPNWNLNTNINKKVKIGFLLNGNMSTNVYKVQGKPIALKNTCSFDAIAQILAGAYAYIPSFRSYMENSEDEVFKIAIALGKNENMRKINTMRAKLMYNVFKSNRCEMVVASMINAIFKHSSCYVEVTKCEVCRNSIGKKFRIIYLNNNVFNNDLTKLSDAITSNFNNDRLCEKCKNRLQIHRQFESHLFIEIPIVGANASSDVEPRHFHELWKIPVPIVVGEKEYFLFGVIVFVPPVLDGDMGHYFSIIKINNTWQAFDDLNSKPKAFSSLKKILIHGLFYIENSE